MKKYGPSLLTYFKNEHKAITRGGIPDANGVDWELIRHLFLQMVLSLNILISYTDLLD
jgi:hypothetical protein